MSNESTVLSFEDAKLRAGRTRRSSAARSHSRSSNQSDSAANATSPKQGSLAYVFDMSFDGDGVLDAADDFANAALDVTDADIEGAEEEIGTASKRGLLARANDAIANKKRQMKKAKAEKAFEKSMGPSRASAPTDAGPRAALYSAKMGAKHKHATRMQQTDKAWGSNLSFSLPSISLPEIPRKIMATLCALGCVALLLGMLYTPAQQCYQQLRERDRLTAEYHAIVERNDSLQTIVDNLNSDEGIEDKAHSEFGLIKRGESAGAVTGFTVDDPSEFQANIAPGSVPAPETWYSGVLDFLFGYSS